MITNPHQWKVGDKARLPSDDITMTVIAIGTRRSTGEPYVECQWHDTNRNLKTRDFPPDALVPVEKD
jgi:uncharacterized protein YodC (DUF2158 family)